MASKKKEKGSDPVNDPQLCRSLGGGCKESEAGKADLCIRVINTYLTGGQGCTTS
jgi:hypothetical protein